MNQKIWKVIPPSPHADQLARETGKSPIIAQLLINRGILDKDAAASFFSPQLSGLMNPMLMKDMDSAIELVLETIDQQGSITIYGDFDADGLTATALLLSFFSSIDIPATFYIPNRLSEGYSLNPHAIEEIASKGPGLIITVDCGISNPLEIRLAQQLGLKVIVTDHHQIPIDFEPVCPVIDPHRPDSLFPFKDLSGVGVAFYLAVAIRAALREQSWFDHIPEPDLKPYLDLVALGTVADMVPLRGQNRILVHTGIMAMKDSLWPGIKALQTSSGMDEFSDISSYDLAYKLVPRLNASGRIDDPLIGLEVLTTSSMSIAMEKAEHLNRLNSQRQAIEGDILKQIEETIIPSMDMKRKRSMVFLKEGWHKGVLGIVASKLLDRYYRPTIVLTVEDGVATGSGRSIDGFNLHRALTKLSHLLQRFGGHYHAAGLTLKSSNVEALISGLEEMAQEELGEEEPVPYIEMDAALKLSELSFETIKQIQSLSPFGKGNPEPIFYADSVDVVWSGIVGEKHLKLKVRQGGTVLDAIGFGLAEQHPLDGKTIKMAFTPEVNQWQGYEKIQLRIEDLEITA